MLHKNYVHFHNHLKPFPSISFPHSSINLSTKFFLHLQFLQSKHSQKSHGLSQSESQLLRFQINPVSHMPLSINSLYSHLHLSLFHLV